VPLLGSLFAKHAVTQLDAFIIDVEGFDWEIIQTLPFRHTHPTLLVYEHLHLKPAADAECSAFWKRRGIKFYGGTLTRWLF